MILWLKVTNLQAYDQLTSSIPNEIGQLWNERAPLEQFELALSRLVTLHRHCCELYHASLELYRGCKVREELQSFR
jgi:hypothetical protein